MEITEYGNHLVIDRPRRAESGRWEWVIQIREAGADRTRQDEWHTNRAGEGL